MSRKLTRVVLKIIGGNFQPDTGLTLTIKTDAVSPAVVATASESPATSGNYLATWTETPIFGFWYVGATKRDDWGRLWLGVDGQLRPTYLFRKVKFFGANDSPTGAKGSAKTMTSGTSPLGTDIDGNTAYSFTKIPIVAIVKKYQERGAFISTDPSLSSGNVTFAISADDAGENNPVQVGGFDECYADIMIISMD
jgi:hypothetical protein